MIIHLLYNAHSAIINIIIGINTGYNKQIVQPNVHTAKCPVASAWFIYTPFCMQTVKGYSFYSAILSTYRVSFQETLSLTRQAFPVF